jgi:hypothetical protein
MCFLLQVPQRNIVRIDPLPPGPAFRASASDTRAQPQSARPESTNSIWTALGVNGHIAREMLINEPVVRITGEAGCNFLIDEAI